MTMNNIARVTLFFCLTLLFSCSNRGWYDAARQHHQSECNRLPSGTDFEECQRRTVPDYDQYEKSRQQLLKNEKGSSQ